MNRLKATGYFIDPVMTKVEPDDFDEAA